MVEPADFLVLRSDRGERRMLNLLLDLGDVGVCSVDKTYFFELFGVSNDGFFISLFGDFVKRDARDGFDPLLPWLCFDEDFGEVITQAGFASSTLVIVCFWCFDLSDFLSSAAGSS